MTEETLKLLVVDDDTASGSLISGLLGALNRWTFKIGQVHSRTDAVNDILSGRWDAVLVNPLFENGNGPALVSEVRSRGAHLPIIILSKADSSRIDIAAMHAGANDWVISGPALAQDIEKSVTRELTRVRQQCSEQRRRKLDELLCETSVRFINIEPEKIDREIAATVEALGRFADVDRCFLVLSDETHESLTITNEWTKPGSNVPVMAGRVFAFDAFEPILNRTREQGELAITGINGNSFSNSALGPILKELNAGAFLMVPLPLNVSIIGVIGFVSSGHDHIWNDDISRLLRLAGQIISNALQRKHSEEQLRYQREFLRHVLDTSPSMIFVKDGEGRFTLVNRAFAEAYGKSPDEIIGQTDQDIHPNPEEVDLFVSDCDEVLRNRQAQEYPERMTVMPNTGRPMWCQTIRRPLLLPDGKTWQVLSIATDITARKESEQEAMRLQRELLQSQKMEALGQLASEVAHDLNNSLSAVVGHLQLINVNGNAHERERSVDVALQGCRQTMSLVDNLLQFSRRAAPRLADIDAREVVTRTLAFIQRMLGQNITIEVEGSEDALFFRADSAQIQQVLTNLLINAKQAMNDHGSIRLSLNTSHRNIPERFNPQAKAGRYLSICVSDSGPGIPADLQDKIFEPFFTTRTSEGGTGLGLSMVYRIMQNHGGWVELRSEPGNGAAFMLYFPLLESRRPEQIVEEPVRNPGDTILVIDDEPVLVELMQRFLDMAGYPSRGFTSGEEAVRWFADHHTDVALTILDMKMAGADGRICFQKLRQISPQVRVAILSGFIHDDDVQYLLSQGALRFFQKPLRYPDILQWIQETIGAPQRALKAAN